MVCAGDSEQTPHPLPRDATRLVDLSFLPLFLLGVRCRLRAGAPAEEQAAAMVHISPEQGRHALPRRSQGMHALDFLWRESITPLVGCCLTWVECRSANGWILAAAYGSCVAVGVLLLLTRRAAPLCYVTYVLGSSCFSGDPFRATRDVRVYQSFSLASTATGPNVVNCFQYQNENTMYVLVGASVHLSGGDSANQLIKTKQLEP